MRSSLRLFHNTTIGRPLFRTSTRSNLLLSVKETQSSNGKQKNNSWRNFSSKDQSKQNKTSQSSFSFNSGIKSTIVGGITFGALSSAFILGSNQIDVAFAKTKSVDQYIQELTEMTDYESAIQLLDQAIADHPKEVRFYAIACSATLEAGDIQTLKKYVEKGLKLDPKNYSLLIGQFYVALSEEKEDDAINALNKAVDLNPRNSTAYSLRSSYYSTKKEYEKAYQDADLAVKYLPKDATEEEKQTAIWSKWITQIAPLLTQENIDDAIQLLDKAIVECSGMLDPVVLQANLYVKKEDPASAIVVLDKAMKRLPDNTYLNVIKANLLIVTKKFKEAEVVVDSLKRKNPTEPIAMAMKALILAASDKKQEAKMEFEMSKRYAKDAGRKDEILKSLWEDTEKILSTKKGWW